jgi:hypothetical protein
VVLEFDDHLLDLLARGCLVGKLGADRGDDGSDITAGRGLDVEDGGDVIEVVDRGA